MNPHAVDISTTHPAVYKRMVALDTAAGQAAKDAGLDPLLVELVKVRVSQLNGCAFCLRMHTRDAIALGETTDRLALVAAWWESQYFTDAEKAALALAEEVTELPVPVTGADADQVLSPEQVSAVTWLAIVMNAWNRVAVTSHYPVGPEQD